MTEHPSWFAATPEEQAQWAERLRGRSMVDTQVDPRRVQALARTSRDERQVPTRVGASRVIHHRPAPGSPWADALFVNIHGGGFVRGHAERDTQLCAWLADAVGCQVMDIDYRLAPEHPFPTALHECFDVVRWAHKHAGELGLRHDRIAVGGHSAGGNLTAGICILARRSAAFQPCLQILDYPFLDAVTDPAEKARAGGLIPAERMRAFNAMYLSRIEELSDPLVSTVLADKTDLQGQPPALVILAGRDALRLEAQQHIVNLVAAGVEVTARTFLDSEHGFIVHGQGACDAALDLIVESLRRAFAAPRID
ncbi:MAG: hypothetical protein RLZ83_1452 [Pseudomonadota bacterium]